MALEQDLFNRLKYALGSEIARDQLVSLLGGPLTFGSIYYADFDNGSDSNDGLSMDTAFKTTLKGYNTMTSGAHDYLLMSANSADDFTAELAVTKSRVHFVGLDGASRHMGQGTRWQMSTGGSANSAVVTNTGVRNTFHGIKVFNTDSSTSFAVADGGEYTQWSNVEMVNTQNLGTVTDAHLLCEVDTGKFVGCSIGSSQSGHAYSAARGNVLFTRDVISGKVCRDTTFDDCIFPIQSSNTGAACFLLTGATSIERILWVKKCVFWGTKLSSTIDRAIQVDTNQTDGDILCDGDCTVHGITALVDDSLTTVYHGKTGAATDTAMVAQLGGA